VLCSLFDLVAQGNHDVVFHPAFYEAKWSRFHKKKHEDFDPRGALKNCIYLEDSGVVSSPGAWSVYGSPWQPEFCDWAFNLDRGAPLREKWCVDTAVAASCLV
jgi:hypothetical protein